LIKYTIGGTSLRNFKDDSNINDVIKQASETCLPIILHVHPDYGASAISSEKPYLRDMPDPVDSDFYTILSFYRFSEISNLEGMVSELQKVWKPFSALGRVYIAREGVNAQMAVPTNVIKNFIQACESIPIFKDLYINPDHIISRSDFEQTKPFKALHIRIRDQIVADGFDNDDDAAVQNLMFPPSPQLDWQKSGHEMPPLEWHTAVSNPNAIVLDCRNSYESDVGIFENAIPLNTTYFRESWTALDEILAGRDKSQPILTYCTGGIRCVKINAYLEQTLGFSNVSRLQGGIIAYARELEKINEEIDGK
jgi:predicted sulfurtransferase